MSDKTREVAHNPEGTSKVVTQVDPNGPAGTGMRGIPTKVKALETRTAEQGRFIAALNNKLLTRESEHYELRDDVSTLEESLRGELSATRDMIPLPVDLGPINFRTTSVEAKCSKLSEEITQLSEENLTLKKRNRAFLCGMAFSIFLSLVGTCSGAYALFHP